MHTRYDSSKSSTYQEDGRAYSRASKDVSLSGFLSKDNFHVSWLRFSGKTLSPHVCTYILFSQLPHLELMNQTFIEVTKMSKLPFMLNKADGIVGLAYESLSEPNTVPFFYNLLKQGVIKQPIFTFYMNR